MIGVLVSTDDRSFLEDNNKYFVPESEESGYYRVFDNGEYYLVAVSSTWDEASEQLVQILDNKKSNPYKCEKVYIFTMSDLSPYWEPVLDDAFADVETATEVEFLYVENIDEESPFVNAELLDAYLKSVAINCSLDLGEDDEEEEEEDEDENEDEDMDSDDSEEECCGCDDEDCECRDNIDDEEVDDGKEEESEEETSQDYKDKNNEEDDDDDDEDFEDDEEEDEDELEFDSGTEDCEDSD